MQHNAYHARRRGCNAIFRAVFSGKCDPAAADGFLLQGIPVKAEAFIRLCPFLQGFSSEGNIAPCRKLLIPCSPNIYAVMDLWSMPVCLASAESRREVSSPVPVPNTRPRGKPKPFASCCVTTSQGVL